MCRHVIFRLATVFLSIGSGWRTREERRNLVADEAVRHGAARLYGCYPLKTDLPVAAAYKQVVQPTQGSDGSGDGRPHIEDSHGHALVSHAVP